MDLSSLKVQIQTKSLRPFYIFTGPEVKIRDLYIEQMAKVTGRALKNLDTIHDLAHKMYSRSVLSDAFIYVVAESKEFLSDEELQSVITQNRAFQNDILVFVYSAIDKRSKLYKRFTDQIVEFEYLKPAVLVKYIQKDINLGEENCKRLIDCCGADYSRILLEIDKIQRYAKNRYPEVHGDGADYNRAFVDLLRDGTIHIPPYDAVFDFVEAVLQNRAKSAFELLAKSYEAGEATMVLLANLYSGAKATLQVQSWNGEGKVTESTGLTPFQVKLANGRKGKNSNGDLVYLMRLVREAEKGIKTGTIEDMMAVPYVLVNFWG